MRLYKGNFGPRLVDLPDVHFFILFNARVDLIGFESLCSTLLQHVGHLYFFAVSSKFTNEGENAIVRVRLSKKKFT